MLSINSGKMNIASISSLANQLWFERPHKQGKRILDYKVQVVISE